MKKYENKSLELEYIGTSIWESAYDGWEYWKVNSDIAKHLCVQAWKEQEGVSCWNGKLGRVVAVERKRQGPMSQPRKGMMRNAWNDKGDVADCIEAENARYSYTQE